jgi:hypothetical protein
MSILSRIFGGAKEPDPLDGLDEPAELEDKELGLFAVDTTQRPASVALRVEQLRARAPGAEPSADGEPEDDEAVVNEIAEPAELLPQQPQREEPAVDLSAIIEDVEPSAEGEDAAATVAEGEANEDAEEPAEAVEGADGGEQPAAPVEVQTIAAPKDEDALSMFRSTGANAELTAMTEGLEDEAAEDLLKEAREISSWLDKKDAA